MSRKRRMEILVGRYFANPLARGLARLGLAPRMLVELETVGRVTGKIRRVPLTGAPDRKGVWLIAQHGRGSGWVHNIEASPAVRVRVGRDWHSGVARLLPEDDVRARARGFGAGRFSQALAAAGFRALETNPVTVRVDYRPGGGLT
ncbi:nitroreductase/quinone reductase family protein [Amycolatopsis anabasis]|uniref:nitroreductase/quinone reductase family protein n=1 Tax=Amycolatopsis anabasis TaxID=1840409 RepID=UPI00131D79CC|nr:nitroreductase/quinone reductase family protein [Amycolatopsis anabasis]